MSGMSDQKFKVGDVVQLCSGGPKMTVESVNENGTVSCVWFPPHAEQMNKPCAYTFTAEALTSA